MFLYSNTKLNNNIDIDVIYVSIVNYIISIALIKYFEHNNNILGFFNIYIIFILFIDIGFTIFNYINSNLININKKNNNFDIINDDIINSNFDINEYNKKINNYKKTNNINNKIKIISKISSDSELKKFNSSIFNKKNIDIPNNISDSTITVKILSDKKIPDKNESDKKISDKNTYDKKISAKIISNDDNI
jgi:hypothetical protein